jgi:CheY-like chemotaxis protein
MLQGKDLLQGKNLDWIKLVHWNAAEAAQRAQILEAAGYTVNSDPLVGLEFLKTWRENPPTAVVIDLSRLPSQGREIAMAIRHSKATRAIPVVFVGGDPQKVKRIQELLPDAVYTDWDFISGALKEAIAHPPAEPVAPKSLFDAYAGQALPKKLGIRPGMAVLLVGAPKGFNSLLGELPENTSLEEGVAHQGDIILWFVRSRLELEQSFEALILRQDFRFVWIAWPKKASGVQTDLTQQLVRETGLRRDLVDFKICSIDQTWSGLCFTRRK